MEELTRGARRVLREDVRLVPFEELWIDGEPVGAEIGRRRANFPGTDTLAMNALSSAEKWIERHFYDVVCAEGDRLTHIRFLDAAAAAGYRVNFFLLQARMNVLDERCAARGSKQDRTWRAGRATMCSRVSLRAEEAGHRVWHLDSERPMSELAAVIREHVPVLEKLKEKESGRA